MSHIVINGVEVHFSPESRVLLHVSDDRVISARELRKEELIASLATFLEIAERAGFLVTYSENKL